MKKIVYLGILFISLIATNVNAGTGATWCEYGEKGLGYFYNDVENIIQVNSFVETTNPNDEYLTIEKNSVIIANTKFTSDQIITAYKAAKAGYDYAIREISSTNYFGSDDSDLDIYIYYGEVGGWYKVDSSNNAIYIEDQDKIDELSSQKIYSINNVHKGYYLGTYDKEYICASVNFYTIDAGNNMSKYYYSALNNSTINLENVKISVACNFGTNGDCGHVVKTIVIEDVPESVSGQKRIYVGLSNNGYDNAEASDYLRIYYKNGGSESIFVDENGYLIPNITSIDRIVFA